MAEVIKKKPGKKTKALDSMTEYVAVAGKDRTLHDWLEREDNKLMEIVFDESRPYNIFHISNELRREPMTVLRYILGSELPEMIGFDVYPSTEEEAEFIGLALGGVPLQMCFKWCIAAQDRPTHQALAAAVTGKDYREFMHFVREHGLWVSSMDHLAPVDGLLDFPSFVITETVGFLVEQFDAPTPAMVFQQICGERPQEGAVAHTFPLTCYVTKKRTYRAKSARSTSRKSSGWRRKRYSRG